VCSSDLPVLRIPDPQNLEEMAGIAQHLGTIFGNEKKAKAIIKRIEALGSTTPPRQTTPVLWWWEGGLSGARHPLLVHMMKQIGVEIINPSKTRMSVEDVLMADAEVVVAPAHYAKLPALSSERLGHPALRHGTKPLLVLSGNHFTCLTPVMLDGVEKLKKLLGSNTGGSD